MATIAPAAHQQCLTASLCLAAGWRWAASLLLLEAELALHEDATADEGDLRPVSNVTSAHLEN